MTDDGYPDRPNDDPGPGRTRMLLGGGLAVFLLAVIGGSVGWLLAGRPDGSASPGPGVSTPVEPSGEPSTDTPRTTVPARPTRAYPGSATGLTVPELVGTDFAEARQELRDRKLGWRLVFGDGTGRSVERTSPEPGTPVRRGVTVTLWVAGPAPDVPVPGLIGQDCAHAADDLVEAGLYPRYRTGRRGTVTAQEPAADTSARWNDQVALTCGDTPPPSVAPTPTP